MPTDVLTQFHASTATWFASSVGTPTAVQQEAWPAIAGGGHVLITAPTGTGKTLSAFLVYIDRLKQLARRGKLKEELYLIYVSPLKALGNDIRENLRRPLDGIDGPEITAAVRTGDTTQSERRRMLKHPPHILITTPESLYLLLTSQTGREMLKPAQAIILDELHAMINSKRGAHLMLSLARLDRLCARQVQRIGLSATIEPLEDAAAYLGGSAPVSIVAPAMHKARDILVNGPLEDMRTLPEGTIWPEIARLVYEHCQGARTVIAFVEGRASAEKLAFYVNALGGEDFARTHHGSVSKEQRLEAELLLRSGTLRLLCATSSMELGIDVGEVDLVLQLGYPREIASTMQRLGRAGHNPGRTSVMHMFPRMIGEIVFCGLTADVALAGGIEHSHPPRQCLDVVAQHLVAMAAVESYTVDDVMAMLASTYNFRDVQREDVISLLGMLAGDFEHAQDHPARPRLLYDRIHARVEGDAYSRMLALSAGGTIPDRGLYTARLRDGTRLGELDEEFVFEARIGDKFLLGSFAWRIEEITRDAVVVTPTTPEGAQSPFWKGDWAGRSFQTGQAFGKRLRRLGEAQAAGRLRQALGELHLDDFAARNATHFLQRQIEATGCLPDDRTIIVEHFRDAAGEHQLMVHSIFGGRVNAGLSVLLQEIARRETHMDVACFDHDDGLLLFPYGGSQPIPDGLLQRIDPARARPLLEALLPETPLFSVVFRHNVARALLLGARQGKRLPLWIQRLRGAQVLDNAVLQGDHPMIRETKRECLEDHWDLPALETVLTGIHNGAIAVRELHLNAPSPMALPLRRTAEAVLLYDYFPTPRGVHQVVSEALAAQDTIPPEPAQLQRVAERRRLPQDSRQLHSLLMMEGDLVAGEIDIPVAWLEELAWDDRALYIEPGLWICAEHAAQYSNALEAHNRDDQLHILRRCLRYRGPQTPQSAADRYFWPETQAKALLDALVEDGKAVLDQDTYYHAELYARAQRETVAARRRQIETLPPERYAALLAQQTRVNAGAAEQLQAAIEALCDQPYPLAQWESVLLPARVAGYKPQMLDELLAGGEFYWQLQDGERPTLTFHRSADIDWDRDVLAYDTALADEDRGLVDALVRRGASFAQSLTGVLANRAPLDALMGLAERGLARADSLAPVRQWMGRGKRQSASPRVRMMARTKASLAGRWELTRPLLETSLEADILRAFTRVTLLCRETAQGLDWNEALRVLRVWEYTGQVRRGYFIRGLSGAQFIFGDAFQSATLAMEHPREETIWLNATDPAQAWGKVFAHGDEAPFTNVSGTAVALRGGLPVAVLERQGNVLRILHEAHMEEALQAFARDYRQGRVFSQHTRVIVKQYPEAARDALVAAGFTRQMLDYEMWQKRV